MQVKSANIMSAQLGQDAGCRLLALPEGILSQILPWDDWFTALSLAATCRKLHAVFKVLQPPATVLDCDVTRPKFNTSLEGIVPALHVFQFEWDEWADALISKMLLKKKRDSQSIGHGLAKLFCVWTQSEAAKTWQEKDNPQARMREMVCQTGFAGYFSDLDTLDIRPDPDQKDFWECRLSVPNMHWDTDDRRLQKHLSTVLQPLVEALTEFANTKGPNVPHISVLISNYDDGAFWPKYADPPPGHVIASWRHYVHAAMPLLNVLSSTATMRRTMTKRTMTRRMIMVMRSLPRMQAQRLRLISSLNPALTLMPSLRLIGRL